MASKLGALFYFYSAWLLVTPVACGSIAAWWNGRGPNIILQDDATGGIRYSLCNGNYTPIVPDDNITAPLTSHPPKKNTSLAATGWVDDKTSWASIFYLDDNDAIVNSLLQCDWGTGRWMNNGDYVISGGAPKAAPTSGLSAVLLGATDGYRVFYNDLEGTLHHVGYTSNTEWAYYGVVSQDQASSQAIGSTFYSRDNRVNITVVRPRDSNNFGESRLYSDHLWHVSSLPEPLTRTGNQSTNATSESNLVLDTVIANFSLPAWSGNPSSIGVGIDNSLTRYIFYIGNDSQLYQLYNGEGYWAPSERPDETSWPAADTAGGPLGIASDSNTQAIRLYYTSGGKVVEVASNDGKWAEATVLPSVNETQPTSSSDPSGTSTSGATPNGGLSGSAKAGVSAGVTIGVIAIGGMAAALFLLRRRQRQLDAAAATAAAASAGSGNDQNTTYGSQPPSELVGAAYRNNAHDGYAPQGYPPQQPLMYSVDQNGYAQAAAYSHPQQQQQGGGGGWGAYDAATNGGDQYPLQQYSHNYQQPPNYYHHPQEMPAQSRPVEMMGEGHYKEAP
ncbi:hypothetical protein F5X99DRAFT_413915 [Biscogniauxia marginata]|nr:hypothetical protein F5X99DRAFT_413915 [Biscogniauxia marginata]